jgi:hypothetical protein
MSKNCVYVDWYLVRWDGSSGRTDLLIKAGINYSSAFWLQPHKTCFPRMTR